jgi:diguanylate cyclase
VAGLGAAAVCACFAFSTILQSVGGDALAVATNLAYPLGDVLLLALIVGGIAVVPGRRKAPWLLFAAACALNTVGDTFNLFQSSSQIGILFNAIAWPTAILLMSMSVWLPPGRSDPLAAQKTPGFLLPGLGAISGLAILFVGTMHRVEPIALGLATATLAIVGLRLSLSVQRLRTLTEQRHQQAVTDELTGLGNRRQLFQVLDAFFADYADPRTAPRDLAFLFVDLDHFKEVNDSFGHSTGDLLLKQLGPRLSGCLRGNDLLVRLGGDELGVVLMDTDPAYAATVAQRLTAKLEEPFILDAVPVRIGASIGIAVAPTDATNGAELLRCADLAMYRAKLRDTAYEVYQQDIDDGGNRLRLVHDLRKAVDGGQFVLHYQPQLDLKTGTVSAVEALIRWPHPRLGLIPPLDFLPLAEEAGLMQPLTAWVLDQALTQCAAWWAEGSELAVSVNVSTTNLLHPGFAAVVSGMLTRHNLPASALILEITETTIIADFERSKFVIGHLRALGLGVSIDDFGAGFTSLAYLGSLAVSELKLDRTFITSLATENRTKDLALVRGTIDLGHALGLRVVAEGIEDRATLDLLTRMGCDLAQGYFIGKPMAPQDLALRSLGSLAPSLAALKAS